MALVHLQTSKVSEYIFLKSDDSDHSLKVCNESIVFQEELKVNKNHLELFIKKIIGEQQYDHGDFKKYTDSKDSSLDFHGAVLKTKLGSIPIDLYIKYNYDGQFVWLRHLDRYTNSYSTIKLDVFEFIARFITHIPDRYFKGIRYYGWLANRVRSKKLPIVYAVLKNEVVTNQSCKNISWKSLLIKEFQFNPLRCDCGDYFVVIGACFDSLLKEFIYKHHNIIKLKCA